MLCTESIEVGSLRGFLNRAAIHQIDMGEWRAFAPARCRSNLADDLIAGSQAEALNQLLRDVHIVVGRQVAGFRTSYEAHATPEHIEDSERCFVAHVILGLSFADSDESRTVVVAQISPRPRDRAESVPAGFAPF